MCDSNPDKNNTLHIDDNFDEAKFLLNYGDSDESKLAIERARSGMNSRQVEKRLQDLNLTNQKSNGQESKTKRRLNLDRMMQHDEEFEMEERKDEISRQRPVFNNYESDDDNCKKKVKENEDCMILPHFHKHDLFK